MTNELLLTPEGLEKLKEELTELKENARRDVINRIKTAKEFGDLSENAEYEEAKNAQAFIEGRIQELEDMIRRAKVVVHHEGESRVGIGSHVTIEINGEKETYEIVGTTESDPVSGKISSDSPIGNALMGKKVGDKIEYTVPAGSFAAKILELK